MNGINHLIECQCILPQYKKRNNPPFHRFVVFSIVDDSDDVVEKFSQCNNCGIVHRVYDICKSEIASGHESLNSLPSKDDFLTLKIWGQWISEDPKDGFDSSSSMRLWKNPNLLIAPKLYHHHKPTIDSHSGLHVWKIPLGKCDFISSQSFHFSLPDWNLAKLFEINRIEVTSGHLMGTNVSIDQIFNARNIDKLFSEDQWTHSFQLLDRWFVLIITIQLILAFCMLRYFMLAQAYLCLMFFCLLASYWYQWPFRYDTEKATLVETNSKLRRAPGAVFRGELGEKMRCESGIAKSRHGRLHSIIRVRCSCPRG